MPNGIMRIDFQDRSLAPAQAEVWVRVVPKQLDAGTEVRGRLLGPRCAYSSTVEVAYPLRPLPARVRAQGEGLTMRVVIPEASLWEPESPFLYEGPVELWQDGVRCERILMRHGLRAFGLTPRGLLVNGKVRTLRGLEVDRGPTEDQARQLRRDGINLLIADVATGSEVVWDAGNRLGFFVLGRVADGDADTLRRAATLTRHASFLGWLAPAGADFLSQLPGGGLIGVEAGDPAAAPPPAAFVVGPAGPEGQPLVARGGGLVFGSVRLPAGLA